jgi:MFS family permease
MLPRERRSALLDTRSAGLVIAAAVGGLIFHAAMYGPQAAFITELFGTEVRYSGASLGYQLAGVLGGALAPIVAVALLDGFGSPWAIALYVFASLLVTITAVLMARETATLELTAEQAPEEAAAGQPPQPRARPVFH